MPIILAPPSPLGSAASIGIGAGIAEQNAKMFPTLASLYAHIASLHGAHGASGGTQGSSSVSPGAGGQGAFPSGYDPAAEQQANRDQQSQNLQAQLSQPDYVGQHIQAQQQFKLQQQQEGQQARQQELARLNAPEPPPPQWGQAEQEALTKATQVVARTKQEVDAGQLAPESGQMMLAPYQDKIDALTQQQEAYQKYQQNKQFQAASQAQAQKRALVDTDMRHAADNGYRQVPDLPTPIYDLDQHGKKYMVNHEVYKAAADAAKDARAHNSKMDLERAKAVKEPAFDTHKEASAAESEAKMGIEDITSDEGKKALHKETQRIFNAKKETFDQNQRLKVADPRAVNYFTKLSDTVGGDLGRATDQQLADLAALSRNPKAVALSQDAADKLYMEVRKVQRRRRDPGKEIDGPITGSKEGAPLFRIPSEVGISGAM